MAFLVVSACSTTEPGDGADGTGGNVSGVGGQAFTGGSGGESPGVGGSPDGAGGGDSGGGPAAGGTASGGMGVGAGGTGSGGGAVGGGDGGGAGGSLSMSDTVTLSNSTYTFQHYPIETDASDVWNGPASPATPAIGTTFDTMVLDNGILSVTLLPEYGGRILSIVHQPTGTELLYQNPFGTPYLMGEDIFYFDYLVILGGIFPSFPDPEHGRNWNQPYTFEVVSESDEAITVRMSKLDDTDLALGVPPDYSTGRTDILVELDVTLRAGHANLELSTKLTNTLSSPSPEFEYWTVTTLAPGSTPGNTAIPLNTRILAKMDQVRLLEEAWPWFSSAEERVSDDVFTWDNLSYFENWVEQGTAFANPQYQENWSGLINNDSDRGIVRASDSVANPGLKLWTFGRDSLTVDMGDPDAWLRPTIEMWHGITPEFWQRTTMAGGEVRQWSDSYLPTLGLSDVTEANEYGALYLSTAPSGAETQLSAAASLSLPGQPFKVLLRLDGNLIAEEDVVASATEATVLSVTVSAPSPGAVFEAEYLQGDVSLLAGQISL